MIIPILYISAFFLALSFILYEILMYGIIYIDMKENDKIIINPLMYVKIKFIFKTRSKVRKANIGLLEYFKDFLDHWKYE